MVGARKWFLRLLLCLTSTSSQFSSALWADTISKTTPEITVNDLAALRDLGGLSVSPDANWVAFQVRQANPRVNRYDLAWYIAPTNRPNAAVHLADAGEPILSQFLGVTTGAIVTTAPAWSPDSSSIAYLRRENGRTQIWRSTRDGQHTEKLTNNAADVQTVAYSRDGKRIFFRTQPSRHQIDAGLRSEAQSGYLYDSRFLPFHSSLPALPAGAAFSGTPLIGVPSDEDYIWVYDLVTRRERTASPVERDELLAPAVPRIPPDHTVRGSSVVSSKGTFAWTIARDPHRQGFYAPVTVVAQLAPGGDPIVCSLPECTGQVIRDIWWRNGSEVVFARGEGPRYQDTALYAWRVGSLTARLILRTANKLTDSSNYEWRCTIAHDRLICFYEKPDYPRRLVGVDMRSGTIETIFDPNSNFSRFNLGPAPRRLQISTRAGVETHGYLVLPPEPNVSARAPLVVVTYRCSQFLRGGTGDEYPIYPLAAQGFAVLCYSAADVDYDRLAHEQIGAYAKWSRGPGDPEKRRVQDALDSAITQLDQMGVIDPTRVGLTGLSFGAEITHFALFNMPRLAAAIASGPSLEPMGYYLKSAAQRDQMRSWGLGAPHATPARWRGLALSENVGRVRSPLLLNVADHEMLLTLQPAVALSDAGRAVEMYVHPDEYHIKWQPTHRLAIYSRNVEWMNFWLQGREDPAPEKVEQYKRWRAMRVNQCELFKGSDAPWYCRQ